MTTTHHKRSFTHVSPLTGNVTIRYYHECLHCRKEYASSRERGLSGWCSHRCQTLGLAEAYKREENSEGFVTEL